MKNLLLLSALLISTFAFSQVTILTTDTTWSGDFTMDGKYVVESGVTLTIEPGTVIKATPKADPSNASALVVAKGGKLMAEGTASLPIIFTAQDDSLTAAMVASGTYFDTNGYALDIRGEWGGVILLGDNVTGAGTTGTATIEGIGAGESWSTYGGTATNDNSGVLTYVSIRHGGATVSPGNEINGLTLGGVGNGTKIENIEIISNNDDGIEFFGGNVDVTNLLVFNCIDDAIDIDQAYSGTVTNALVVMGTDSDNVFEIDGTESSANPVVTGSYTINNVTAIGANGQTKFDQYGHWKSDATGANNNIVFKDFASNTTIEGIDPDTYGSSLTFSNIDFVTSSTLAAINVATDNFGGAGSASLSSTEAEVVSSQVQGTGANLCVFSGWTAYATVNTASLCESSTVGTGGVTILTTNTTWSGDVTMDGKVVVESGVTLTIEPGTVIKATPKADPTNASALVVAKGGKLMAEGTASLPIVFTAQDDSLTAAMVASGTYFDTNGYALDIRGEWGGVILLGDNVTGAGTTGTATIEGIGAGESWSTYGGTATNDNSGVLTYVSIRHGGATVSPGNEINGLTLGGVGNGTKIENIEIISNNDDGIEFFGGNVDVTNLLVFNCIDDAIDIDQAYSGTITNALVAMGTDSDNVFEIDGTESSATPVVTGSYTINNVTAIGATSNTKLDQYGHWKSDATGANNNIVFKDFASNTTIEGIDPDTYGSSLTFSNIDFVTTSTLAAINVATDNFGGAGSASLSSTEAEVVSSQVLGTGANEEVFHNWTAYFYSGEGVLSVEDNRIVEETFTVYPNPFNNVLNVSNKLKVESLKLFNISGQLVKRSLDSNSMNVEELAKGIYFLEVVSGTDRKIKKVIKQ